MLLTDLQVAKFQAIYKAKFGKEISREEAYERGAKLVSLMQLIYRPMTQAEFEQVQQRRQQLINEK